WGEAVAVALPDLADLADTLGRTRQADAGPEAFGETRSLDALTVLLDVLGRPARPALVLLDDCQWADGLTIKLLARWQAHLGALGGPDGALGSSGVHVLVVAAFRSEEVPARHPLRGLEPLGQVKLAPFGADDVAPLCASMAWP